MKRASIFVALAVVVSLIAVTTVMAAEQTISGMVEKKGNDIVIKTDKGDFTATGGGIDKMVGKKVKATGDVAGQKITVKKAEEAK